MIQARAGVFSLFCSWGCNVYIAHVSRFAHEELLTRNARDALQRERLPDLKVKPTVHLLDRSDHLLHALPLRSEGKDPRPLPDIQETCRGDDHGTAYHSEGRTWPGGRTHTGLTVRPMQRETDRRRSLAFHRHPKLRENGICYRDTCRRMMRTRLPCRQRVD